jgi:hypothetical protein
MNTKRYLFILFVILAQALAACGTVATPAAPASEPTLAPTAAPAPTATPEPVDPTQVVQGFWSAIESGDVDAALDFVAEDAQCRGACYITGKDSLRFYLQGIIKAGLVTEISDLTVKGDTVTYLYKVFRNGQFVEESAEGESMQVVDGKIILWNNLHTY